MSKSGEKQNRVAFVTGGASGLGRGIAHRLASEGFLVVIADIDAERSKVTVDEIRDEGGNAIAVGCDVGDLAAVEAARDEVMSGHDGIDVLVNNAGFDTPGFFLETDPSSWQRLLDVTLLGTLNCTHAIAPLVATRAASSGYGRIVNIASDAGRAGSLGEAVYSAAKGGVIAFSKSMARELARDGVTVNAVCPGPADTPMTDAIAGSPIGAKLIHRMVEATPLGRLATPQEVAAAVSYFCSPDAGFVTGQALSVSGGITMH